LSSCRYGRQNAASAANSPSADGNYAFQRWLRKKYKAPKTLAAIAYNGRQLQFFQQAARSLVFRPDLQVAERALPPQPLGRCHQPDVCLLPVW
jgi:hypothetical protein